MISESRRRGALMRKVNNLNWINMITKTTSSNWGGFC
jgi:hypothetical protein